MASPDRSSSVHPPVPLVECRDCPRLVAHLESVRQIHPDYYSRPVPGRGDRRSRLLIVGLAPGLHGANRTGQPFVGDDSGRFLFDAMTRHGLAVAEAGFRPPESSRTRPTPVRITNAVKCLPPGNQPTTQEMNTCRQHLLQEIDHFTGRAPRRTRVILTLGGMAHRSVARVMAQSRVDTRRAVHPFRHAGETTVHPSVYVLSSYHPSRLNTNTGRLTADMLDRVMARAVLLLSGRALNCQSER